ncbi:MAG: ABC transporter ATP-binding protein [Acidimicrobiales bacterium]
MVGVGTAPLREDGSLIRVENLVVEFPGPGRSTVQAVSDVSFDVVEGETLGIVGESGCGKSTTAKAMIQLPRPTDGSVWYRGQDLTALAKDDLRKTRSDLQMIFQDPISSLNPRRSIWQIIKEGVDIWGTSEKWSDARLIELIESVGIDPKYRDRKPFQFSGGQCQRISIARALALDPHVLISDEPVSALDVSVQAQILNLLDDLKAEHQLTMLFISHDLAVVRNVSDRVMVMYLGRVAEIGDADSIFDNPAHPYTKALLAAVPGSGVIEDGSLTGELPSPLNPPEGCRFHTRCAFATDVCRTTVPEFGQHGPDHWVACHHPQSTAVALDGV